MTENKVNKYVPKLVDSNKAYIKDMKKKIALSNYLSNFNSRASKDLNKFLTNSNRRYKIVKCGNGIEEALNQTVKIYSPLSNAILNNKFYTELSTIEEEKKLKQICKNGIENKKLIKQIREDQIKDSYSNIELKFREYLNNLVLEKKGLLKEKKTDNDWRKRVITNYTNDKYEKDSCLMKDIIKDDEEQFNNQLTEYYNEMNNIKEYISNETQEEIKKRKQKIYINLDTLKLLKYSKPETISINYIKNNDEDKIELGKFVSYNKASQRQLNKIKSFKNSQVLIPKNIKEYNLKNEDFANTRSVVKGEANNLFFIKNKFQQKNMNISEKIDEDFPKIEDYSKIIRDRLNKRKLKRKEELIKNGKFLSADEERRLNFNLTLKNNFERWNQDPSELEGYYI